MQVGSRIQTKRLTVGEISQRSITRCSPMQAHKGEPAVELAASISRVRRPSIDAAARVAAMDDHLRFGWPPIP
jgi:hypothetical protein